jgi:hypothetical protein
VTAVGKQDNKEKANAWSADRRVRGGPRDRADRGSVDLARQRSGTPEIRPRRRSVRRGPAPRNRHRRWGRRARPCARVRPRLVRRHRASKRQSRDDPDVRRVLRDPDASRFDERSARRDRGRGRGRRHDRPDRRGRARRPIRPPWHQALRGSERLHRSAVVPPCADCSAGGSDARSSRRTGTVGGSAPRSGRTDGGCFGGDRVPAGAKRASSLRAADCGHASTHFRWPGCVAGRPPRCWFDQAGSPRPRDRSSSVADASPRRGNRPGCEAGAWLRDDVALEARSAGKYRRAAAADLGVEAKSRGAGPRTRLEGFNSRNPCGQAPPARCRLALAGGIGGRRSRNRGNPATAARLGLARDRAYHCLKCRATT